MSGTETVPDRSSGELARLSIPTPVASIRIDGIRAVRTYDDDDGPVLVITDGDTSVEFLCGFSGSSLAAVLGAERLAEATRMYLLAIEAAEGGPDAAGPHAP